MVVERILSESNRAKLKVEKELKETVEDLKRRVKELEKKVS